MIKKTDKIKAPPLFSKGCLVFADSKHSLVKNGNYYRCSLKTNGFCIRETEQLVSAKNLEDRLSRLMDKFMLPEGKAQAVFEKMMGVFVQGMIKGASRDLHIQNNLEATGNLMITDLRAGLEIKKSDFLEFKRLYFQIIKNSYTDLLPGFLIDFLFILIKNKSEQDEMNSFIEKVFKQSPRKLHHNFALQLKTVYLSDEGEIKNIEFEGYGWFVFQYFKNLIPEYRPKLKDGFILNKKKFESLDYSKVIEEFTQNDLVDVYSYNAFATKYAKEKHLKKIFGGFENLLSQEKIDYLIKLNSPTKEMIFALFATLIRS